MKQPSPSFGSEEAHCRLWGPMGGRLELKASLLGAELGRQPAGAGAAGAGAAGAGAAGGLSPLGPSCPQHLSRQCLRPPREGGWWQHSLLCTVHLLSFPFSVAFGFGAAGLSGHLALFYHRPPRATPVHPLWVPPVAAVSRMPIPVGWDDALSGLPTPPAHLQTLPLLRPALPCSPGPPQPPPSHPAHVLPFTRRPHLSS